MSALRFRDQPAIVVDRSVLSFRRIERFLPSNAAIVLPDVFFLEALDDEDDRDRRYFVPWARKHKPASVLVASSWSDMSLQEASIRGVIDPREIIHADSSSQLHHALANDDGVDWSLSNKFDVLLEKQADEAAFSRFCQQLASGEPNVPNDQWSKTSHEELVVRLRDVDFRRAWVQDPRLLAAWIRQHNPAYREPWAESLLLQFPDRLAVSRWSRLMVWFAVCNLAPHSSDRARNDYRDAQYLFAASYVGRLATSDRNMADAAELLFPKCDVTRVAAPE